MLKLMKFIFSKQYFSLSLFVGVLSLCMVGYLLKQTNMDIQYVNVKGDYKYIQHKYIQDAVLPYVNTKLYNISISIVRQELLDLPWISDVAISREWPNKLSISFFEKTPIAIWNAHWIFNQHGKLFFPEYVPEIPIPNLEGPVGSQRLVFEQFCHIRKALAKKRLKLKHMRMDPRHSITIYLTNDIAVKLGRQEPLVRLSRFLNLYDDIIESKQRDAETVDLRYPKGIAVRWKK